MSSSLAHSHNHLAVLDEEDFLLDSNSKERIESEELFQDCERRLNGDIGNRMRIMDSSSPQSASNSDQNSYDNEDFINQCQNNAQNLQSLGNQVDQFEVTTSSCMMDVINEEEIAIENWKDNRLRKLEDFTRDLVQNVNTKSALKATPYC